MKTSNVSLYPCSYIQRVPFRKFHFTYDNSPASILCSHCMSVRLSSILRSRPEPFRLRSIPPPLVTGLETAGGGATALGRLAVSLRACSLSISFTCSNKNTSGIRHLTIHYHALYYDHFHTQYISSCNSKTFEYTRMFAASGVLPVPLVLANPYSRLRFMGRCTTLEGGAARPIKQTSAYDNS